MTTNDREDALLQRIRRITDIAQEPLEFLAAITGYEAMPIKPIDEAVKPLESVVQAIENQAYIAKMRCRNPGNGLTQDEAAAIMLYTMEWAPASLYVVLNATLRMKDRKKLRPWFLYLKLFFVALDRLPSTSGLFLFRGVKLDLSNQYKVGDTFVWWGFSSCAVSMGVLQSEGFLGQTSKRTMFTIECNSGKDIRKHSYLPEEDEVLILPATQFEVIGYLQPAPDLYMIHIKEVQPPFSLRSSVLTPVSRLLQYYQKMYYCFYSFFR
jgi:hypothetical protein